MQKVVIKFILKTYKLKDIDEKDRDKTKCPIYLRVYVDGERTMKSTGHSVEQKHWDKDKKIVKSTHRIASHLNADLTIKKNELYKTLINDQVNGRVVSVNTVKKNLKSEDATTGEIIKRSTYTIITRNANSVMRDIHNGGDNKGRMPLFLPFELSKKWLEDDLSEENYRHILNFEIPSEELKYHPVFTIRSAKTRPDEKPKNEPYEWENLPELGVLNPD